jgi:hypothetical protein
MAEDCYVVMTVQCQHCKAKQSVHVAAPTGFAQMGNQTIHCIKCKRNFDVSVPDKTVEWPFPARARAAGRT